jgi:hypothetical protein
LARIVELIAKLGGELDERAQTNILNVNLDPDTARKIAETYLVRRPGTLAESIRGRIGRIPECNAR